LRHHSIDVDGGDGLSVDKQLCHGFLAAKGEVEEVEGEVAENQQTGPDGLFSGPTCDKFFPMFGGRGFEGIGDGAGGGINDEVASDSEVDVQRDGEQESPPGSPKQGRLGMQEIGISVDGIFPAKNSQVAGHMAEDEATHYQPGSGHRHFGADRSFQKFCTFAKECGALFQRVGIRCLGHQAQHLPAHCAAKSDDCI